ncbi:biotin transporter BioY [Streptococcus halichoeri]|uniref:biotin transporter BioY n=1 Tax=Streptococcus halichoeri TaxID=254785 RepID=UPI000DB62BE9|nr:biotin transporter BioY [Streptococcus halichoeri]PZO93895.1 MAG: biotin transporter BioY [Streptococcus pyogenes]
MFTTRDVAKIAMMTALISVLGLIPAIPLGFIPVPLVLQNLGVMLAALLLGGRKGSLAIILTLLIGCFIPIFSGHTTTLPLLVGPTAGYVLAWLLVPLTFEGLTLLAPASGFGRTFGYIWLSGVLLVDVLGAVWLAGHLGMPLDKALVANLAFVPGDTIKALLATLIAQRQAKLGGSF